MKRKEQVIIKSATGAPLANTPKMAERRLDNIRPREVSLVDSAANGRSFLIVKRRDDMKPKPKDESLFKGVVAGDPTPAATPAAAAPAVVDPPAAAVVEPTPVVKGEFSKLADSVLQNFPVAKALAMEQKDMFMAMSDALVSFAMGMDMIQSDLMAFMGSDGKTGFMGTEVIKSLKVEFPDASDSELTEKAGKKMKKDRLTKLKKLRDEMDSLIKELDDESNNVTKGGTVNNQGKGTNDQGTQKSADGAAAAPTPAVATPASETPAAQQAAGALTAEQVSEIVTKAVDKAVAPLKTEIEALKNAPAAPAGESTDSTEEVVAKGADGKPLPGKQESIFKGLIR